jgi:hypothetical protein
LNSTCSRFLTAISVALTHGLGGCNYVTLKRVRSNRRKAEALVYANWQIKRTFSDILFAHSMKPVSYNGFWIYEQQIMQFVKYNRTQFHKEYERLNIYVAFLDIKVRFSSFQYIWAVKLSMRHEDEHQRGTKRLNMEGFSLSKKNSSVFSIRLLSCLVTEKNLQQRYSPPQTPSSSSFVGESIRAWLSLLTVRQFLYFIWTVWALPYSSRVLCCRGWPIYRVESCFAVLQIHCLYYSL